MASNDGRLAGKVAIVTGASGGIGEAITRAFLAEGASVMTVDVGGPPAGLDVHHIVADVSDPDAIANVMAETKEQHGRLDVLCNNAGIDGDLTPVAETPVEAFDSVIAVNLRGAFLGTRAALPLMIEGGGGSIVNTASIAGTSVAFPGLAAYCASKAGLLGLTKVTAVEYAAAGVRCNAICPGVIRTALFEKLEQSHPEQMEQIVGATLQRTPQNRLGTVEEIAGAVVFLASDESTFMTGSALVADGGYVAA